MTRRPTMLLLAVALSATLIAAGCGGGGSKASKAAFCADNATLNSKSQKAASIAAAVAIFKANVATIDDFGKTAPSEIKADAMKLVDAAHKVIDTGDLKAFTDTATADAGKRVDAYCTPGIGATTTT